MHTVGSIKIQTPTISQENASYYQSLIRESSLFCVDPDIEQEISFLLEKVQEEGDTMGSAVACHIVGLKAGIGAPIYRKLEACLASAMLSINASKGFEMGSGFNAIHMQGSDHNDPFTLTPEGSITCGSNHAGGVLAGISTGMPLTFKVAFKPPANIKKPQASVTKEGIATTLTPGTKARHDTCLGIRAVPVVEAMAALTLADYLVGHD